MLITKEAKKKKLNREVDRENRHTNTKPGEREYCMHIVQMYG